MTRKSSDGFIKLPFILMVKIYLLIQLIMKEGVVKFFNDNKGFGFIKPSDSGEDVFVHESGLIDQITENDKVEYSTEQGKRGLNAVNVKVIQ
jgi:CspA family cold shock protein